MEGSLGRDGELRKERVTNKGRSFSAIDKPHSGADLEHFLPLWRLTLPWDLPDRTDTWRKFRKKMAHPAEKGRDPIF